MFLQRKLILAFMIRVFTQQFSIDEWKADMLNILIHIMHLRKISRYYVFYLYRDK